MNNKYFFKLKEEINPIINKLNTHEIYSSINSLEALQIFMEYHAFASWDSMSLLKSLQRKLTLNKIIWVPSNNIATRYINELMLEEETDIYLGKPISHFKLYVEAMKEVGASTILIDGAVSIAEIGTSEINEILKEIRVPEFVRQFLDVTFNKVIDSNSLPAIASSIYFARENLIPEIFPGILHNINKSHLDFPFFKYYLERHIELDSGSHSELAENTLISACGNDENSWREAKQSAIDSLNARLYLWDGILNEINKIG